MEPENKLNTQTLCARAFTAKFFLSKNFKSRNRFDNQSTLELTKMEIIAKLGQVEFQVRNDPSWRTAVLS